MSNKTMSDNACYAGFSTPAPLDLNTPKNRMVIDLRAVSDTNNIDISLYEYHGRYWYSFTSVHFKSINSAFFFSLQNCVTSLRETLRGLGFTLYDPYSLTNFVRAWNRQGKKVS